MSPTETTIAGAASLNGTRFLIDILQSDGVQLGSIPVAPDLDPALESARFAAVRRGYSPNDVAGFPVRVVPIWDETRQEPFVGALQVEITLPDMQSIVGTIPIGYFHGIAQDASAQLVERGVLAAGEVFVYRVRAFPSDIERTAGPSNAEDTEFDEIITPVRTQQRAVPDLDRDALALGPQSIRDALVLLPQQATSEILERSRLSPEREIGGFLLGYVHRAAGGCDVFVRVTEQVPARHAQSHPSKLVLTPDTWRDVQKVIALRGKGELLLGYWHLHPWFCRPCPTESRERCAFRLPFYSREDRELHAACFPRAWSLGLLVSDHGTESPSVTLYGWRDGVIVERGFHVQANDEDANASCGEPQRAVAVAGARHATLPRQPGQIRRRENGGRTTHGS